MTRRIEFFSIDSKIEFFLITQRIEYDSKDWTFFQYDSKNRTLFWRCLNGLNPFLDDSRNWTLFFSIWLSDLIFLNKEYDFQEFNLLKNMTPRIELFLIQRIEPLFWIWLTELHIFSNMNHRNVT